MNTLHAIFNWITDASIRASVLALAVMLIQTVTCGRIAACWRYALWLPVLLVLLMPVLPQSQWSGETFIMADAPIEVSKLMVDSSKIIAVNTALPSAPVPQVVDWTSVAAVVWLCGTVLTLGMGIVGYLASLRRFKRTSVEVDASVLAMLDDLSQELRVRRPRVIASSVIETPAVAGVLRPVLLLPAVFPGAFTEAETRLVLKHELLHLRRHDLQVNALVCLVQALHWFNPMLWFAAARARQDREAACDAMVLASEQRDCRTDYGHALLKVQSSFCPSSFSLGFLGIFESSKTVRARIMAIATYRRVHPLMGLLVALMIAGLLVFGATHATPNDVAAIVNGTEITKAELNEAVKAKRLMIAASNKGDPYALKAALSNLESIVLDDLVAKQLVLAEFKKIGGTIKASYVEDDINSIIRGQFKDSREALIDSLAKEGLTLEKFRQRREEMIIVQVMRAKIAGKPSAPTPGQIEEYYKAHADKWRGKDSFKISTITLPKKKGREADSTPEKQAKLAAEIRAKILAGADFGALAKTHSQDSHWGNGGEWPWMESSAISPTLLRSILVTKEGDIGVGEDKTAYILIRIDGKKPGPVPPLEKVRDEIEKLIKSERSKRAMDLWAEEKGKTSEVKKFQ